MEQEVVGGRRSVVDEDDAATTGDDNKDSLPAWPPVIVGRDPGWPRTQRAGART
jgi:hypothetical protein